MRTIKLAMAAGALALAGCSTPPVASGGRDEVQYAGNETIRIAWNPQLTNEQAVRSKARAWCSGREVEELVAPAGVDASGTVVTKTWRCKPTSGAGM